MMPKRSDIIPNYRKQSVTLSLICGEKPSCGMCRRSRKWGPSKRMMYCFALTNKYRKMNRRTRVHVFGLCDRFDWRKIDATGREILGGV